MPPRALLLRASLRDRRFAVLLFAVAINSIGSWASAIALWGAGVYRFHAGPSALSLLIVCWAAPPIVLAPPAGVVVDRIGPRRSLVIAYLGGAVTASCLAFADSLIVMAILAAASGVGRALAAPAGGALPPQLVAPKDLVAANSWLGATGQVGQVCGPLVSSLLLATAGFQSAFLVDAATFLIGAAALVLLPAAGVSPRHRTTLGRELVEGLRIVAHRSTLRALVVVGAEVSFTSGAYLVVEPLYAQGVLGRPASQFALFEAAAGLGAVSGSILAMRLGGRLLRAGAVGIAAIAYGAAAALFVGTRWLQVAYAGAFLWGISGAVFGVASISVLQRLAPRLRARQSAGPGLRRLDILRDDRAAAGRWDRRRPRGAVGSALAGGNLGSRRCPWGVRRRPSARSRRRMKRMITGMHLRPRYPVRTQRLLLRPMRETDVDALVAYRSLPEVCRWVPFEPMTAEVVRERLHGVWSRTVLEQAGQGLTLGVEVEASGALAGDVYLFWASSEQRSGEIGYVLNPRHAGRGYATEAAHAVLHLAFDGLELHRVIARVDADNEPSARVTQRLGMRHEAHLVENEWFKGR